MTDDLITRAEAVDGACDADYNCKYPEIIEELIEEIKRLRSRDKDIAAGIVAMADAAKRYMLMNSKITDEVFGEADSLIGYCDKLEKIVIAKDARIKELEAKLAPRVRYPPLFRLDEEFPETPLDD